VKIRTGTAVLAAVMSLAVASPAAAVTGTWTVMPAQPAANGYDLNAVDSATASSGLAVGTSFNAGEQGVAMRWDGGNWGFVPVPKPNPDVTLTGASVVSATDGWAVGMGSDFGGFYAGTRPVALHWNGSALSVASPGLTVKSKFTAVSALASNNVWAVGRIGANSLVEHWTGASWTQVAVPDPNPANPAAVDSLSAVSARAANDIWAVGSFSGGPFSLHFDGTAWKTAPLVQPAGSTSTTATGVVGVGPGDAWAVGWTFTSSGTQAAVIEHWTGTAWHLVSSLTGTATLAGVTARAANDIWAVGSVSTASDPTVRPLTLHWDGVSWTRQTSPPASGGNLTAVATRPGAGRVVAAGDDSSGFGVLLSHP
jgi:hypothetical protein